jgi:hypothetical protein
MRLFPVITRELRVASRKAGTYWFRSAAAACALGFALFFLYVDSYRNPQAQAQMLFSVISSVCFVVCMLMGFTTADCLSQEQRNGTLGLLFLTDLRGMDVVLGKLVSKSLLGTFMILALFPVLALPLMLGAVSLAAVGMVQLSLLNALFFALTGGLFISAHCRSAKAVFLLTLTLLLGSTVGWVFLVEGPLRPYLPHDVRETFCYPSPLYMFVMGVQEVFSRNNSDKFWASFATVQALGWGFLLFASLRLPRAWRDRVKTPRAVKWGERLRLWSVGHAATRAAYRQRLLDLNPVCWIDDRYRLQKSMLWGVFLCALTGYAFLYAHDPNDMISEDSILFIGVFLNYGLLCWMAFQATQRWAEDHASGALELLCSTRMTVEDLLRGRRLMFRRQFGWLAACLMLWEAAMILGYSKIAHYQTGFTCQVFFAGMGMFLLNARALFWVGHWQGLVLRDVLQATLSSLLLVVGLHWIGFLVGAAVLVLLEVKHVIRVSEYAVLYFWIGLGVAISLITLRRARHCLQTDFRALAAQPPRTFWKSLAVFFGPGRNG